MELKKAVETDYRKWLTFNPLLSEPRSLYELYKAIEQGSTYEKVNINKEASDKGSQYYVYQEGYDESLTLDEKGREQFLVYLLSQYLMTGDVEAWYEETLEKKNKTVQDKCFSKITGLENQRSVKQLKVSGKETRYYNLALILSGLFYLAVFGFLSAMYLQSTIAGLGTSATVLTVFLFILILRKVMQGVFVGGLKGNAVKLHENQYPEIYQLIKEQADALELKEMPEVYIASGNFNAFVTKLARKKYLVLLSEVVETTLKGDYEVAKFVIGHELGHIKRKHLTKHVWLLPAMFVPFLALAYSRACEYTCDRIGYHFSNKGAFEGILILASGKAVCSKINIEQFIKDSGEQKGFWYWFSEKFGSHPHLTKRIQAIRHYSKLRS